MNKTKIIKFIRFLIKILPLSFWLVLIFAFDKPYLAILTLISALFHELGHIVALMKYAKKYRFFSVASGFRLSANDGLSYKEELTVAFFGPLFNILLFLLLIPFILLRFSEYVFAFALINLFTAVSNLLPVEGYDGYRIADCLINQYTSVKIPSAILRSISFFISALLSLTALYLIRSFDGGYWLFFIFLASLFKAILSDRAVFASGKQKNQYGK